MPSLHTLREEYRKEIGSGFVTGTNAKPDQISDWWLSRFSEHLEGLAKALEAQKIVGTFAPYTDERYEQDAHNAAMDASASIIRSSVEGK